MSTNHTNPNLKQNKRAGSSLYAALKKGRTTVEGRITGSPVFVITIYLITLSIAVASIVYVLIASNLL